MASKTGEEVFWTRRELPFTVLIAVEVTRRVVGDAVVTRPVMCEAGVTRLVMGELEVEVTVLSKRGRWGGVCLDEGKRKLCFLLLVGELVTLLLLWPDKQE